MSRQSIPSPTPPTRAGDPAAVPVHFRPRRQPLASAIVTLCLVCAATPSLGEISTDGSMGPARDLSGPNFVIGEDLGARTGTNLFHSFSTFSIGSRESATFTGSGEITNVIGRVTGGEITRIDGLLVSELPAANLWLFNPSGLVVGNNASIDVPGELHLSTGDQLELADGALFQANLQSSSTLSIADPSQFGFLDHNQAQLRFEGSRLILDGVGLSASSQQLTTSEAGFQLDGQPAAFLSLQGNQSLTLENTRISSEHDGPMDAPTGVRLTGGDITLSGTSIETSVLGSGTGPLTLIQGTGDLVLEQASQIQSFGLGEGDIGGVRVEGASLTLRDDGSLIESFREDGTGGSDGIQVQVEGALTLRDNVYISSDSRSAGDAGQVLIRAGSATLGVPGGSDDDTPMITSESYGGEGAGGIVKLEIQGDLNVNPGARIGSDTYGLGDAGEVDIRAANIHIDNRLANGSGSEFYTGFSSDSLSPEGMPGGEGGNAGEVKIAVDGQLSMRGGSISSDSETSGSAGTIQISGMQLVMTGLSEDDPATISSSVYGSQQDGGPPPLTGDDGELLEVGQIYLKVDEVQLLANSAITTESLGAGESGQIAIQAANVLLDGRQGATTISSSTYGDGGAGDVILDLSGDLTLRDQATIGSDTFRTGDAGSVSIRAANLYIDGSGTQDFMGISSDSVPAEEDGEGSEGGNAGLVQIEVEDLIQIRNGWISSDSLTTGDAGTIDLSASRLIMEGSPDDKAYISSIVYGSPPPVPDDERPPDDFGDEPPSNTGLIFLTVSEVEIRGNATIETTSVGDGDAGEIVILGKTLLLDGRDGRANISSDAQGPGNAGYVFIEMSDGVQLLGGATIASDTGDVGNAGVIEINTARLILEADGDDRARISSDAREDSLGHAGDVLIEVEGDATLTGSATISSTTQGEGEGGYIQLDARNLTLSGSATSISSIQSDTRGPNFGGLIRIEIADQLILNDNSRITTDAFASGEAGEIEIEVGGDTTLQGDARIASETRGTGNAGEIDLNPGKTLLLLSGARISTSSGGTGNAGRLQISQPELLRIDGSGTDTPTGLFSSSLGQGDQPAGAVGGILIEADTVQIVNGGRVSIESRNALPGVGGDPDAQLELRIQASVLEMDEGIISAESDGETRSGDIVIELANYADIYNRSFITTASENADAGSIRIRARDIVLESSQITTSVAGEEGNGGDITLVLRGLTMDKGFVQANTAASGASGGEINITSNYLLIPSNQSLVRASDDRVAFDPNAEVSVIQAAAPNGESGKVDIDIPEVDLSAAILAVNTDVAELSDINPSPCGSNDRGAAASLTTAGRGSLPPETASSASGGLNSCQDISSSAAE